MNTFLQKFPERVTKALAVIGFITLLALGAWGSIQVVRFAPTVLSSLASVATSLSSIFVPADDTTTTEEPQESTDLDFSKVSVPTAGERQDGVFPVTSIGISDPNGRIDLAARIIATGIINESDAFVATDVIRGNQKGAVRFEVINLGTKESGQWAFNAVLPTYPRHIFHSQMQQSLLPGDRIEFTLGFDQLDTTRTEGIVTINADPTGSILEISEANNIAQKTIIVTQ